MATISKNWQIIGSLFISGALILGVYVLATANRTLVAEASTESALLQAIATKDSDGDGLPDWEESLYGTDPHTVDSKNLGMSDGEAVAKGLIVPSTVVDIPAPPNSGSSTPPIVVGGVPAPAKGSLTAQFAQNFFLLYLDAKQKKGGLLTQEESAVLAQEAVGQLADSIAPASDFKTLDSLTVSGGGIAAMETFAASVEAVLTQHRAKVSKSELLYLEDLVKNDDTSAIEPLTSIAKNYKEVAAALAVLPVPREVASDYLALINAMARIGDITGDFARTEADPITTMLALGQYPKTVLDFGNALINIHKTYTDAGITLQKGTPGATFVNIIPDIAKKQGVEATQQQP